MASMGLNSVVIDNKADCIEESIVEFNVTFYDFELSSKRKKLLNTQRIQVFIALFP